MATGEVVIIGAEGGLGSALADTYGDHGWRVRRIGRKDGDLADPAEVRRLAAEIARPENAPDLVIFSAGTSEAGYVEDLDADSFRRCLEVNFLAPVTLFRAIASATRCRRFVFVLSGLGDVLVPGFSPYALAKRALRDYLHVRELERSFPGCYVLEVRPGPIATGFDDKTRVHGEFRLPRQARRRSARDVAERIYTAERAGRRRLGLSAVPSLLGRVQATAPAVFAWVIRRHPSFRRGGNRT